MKIDTAGTYTLKYTAEDECGNITEVTREVEAVQITYRTVLYTDGTFIINEKDSDQAANEALHGVATNVYDPFDPDGSTSSENYIFTTYGERPWHAQRTSVNRVEIGSPISPPSTAQWFYQFNACTSMDLGNLDTSETTKMMNMFSNCQALTALDVTHFDTSNVTNMSSMFSNCRVLTSLDVTNFNTSNVTNMGFMFNSCRALTALDVTHFDTSNVTIMSSMFSNCQALTTLDVTHFDTSEVTDMSSMFSNCQVLTALDVTHFDTSKVENTNAMFSSCQVLTTLDLASFDTSNVTSMNSMFSFCYALITIYASLAFVVSQVTDSDNMFRLNNNLVGGAGTTWSSSNPTNKTYARIDGGTANPGYFTAKS